MKKHKGVPKKQTKISFAYHGNYCGPGWSDGEYQLSVDSGQTDPTDELDNLCRSHDTAYSQPGTDLEQADWELASGAYSIGDFKSLSLATAIGGQATLRHLGIMAKKNPPKKYVPRKLRGNQKKQVKQEVKREVRKEVSMGMPAAKPLFLKPRPMIPKIQKPRKGHLLLTDREFIGALKVTDTQKMGDHLLRQYLSPQDLTGTRIAVFSRLYEKYRFRRAVVHYVPMVGSTKAGTIIGFIDVDPDDPPVTGTQSVRTAESATGAQMNHIFQKGAYRLPTRDGNGEFFFTDPGTDQRLYRQGLIDIVAVSDFLEAQTIGFLYLEYEIEFKVSHTTGASLANFGSWNSFGTIDSLHPMGTGLTPGSGNNFDITMIQRDITFPHNGIFFVEYQINATTTSPSLDYEVQGGLTITGEFTAVQSAKGIISGYVTVADFTSDLLRISISGGSGPFTAKLRIAEAQGGFLEQEPKEPTEEQNQIQELIEKIGKLERMIYDNNTPVRSTSGLKSPLGSR